MSDHPQSPHPSDICLLLRCHGEQLWLASQVVPVLRQLEAPGAIPDDQLGAALAYLEIVSLEARRRARETETAFALLRTRDLNGDRPLNEEARRYHDAVRSMREALASKVALLTGPAVPACERQHQHAGR
jgi:hypothetical protein